MNGRCASPRPCESRALAIFSLCSWALAVPACYQSQATGGRPDGDGHDTPSADATEDAAPSGCNATAEVPGGTYWIGDPTSFEPVVPGEGVDLYHQVRLTSFQLDRFEATNRCYRECVEASACSPPSPASSLTRPDYWEDRSFDEYPVVNVTRDQARQYCAFRGGTLPSSAQWQVAATSAYARLGRAYGELPRDPENDIYPLVCRIATCETTRCGGEDDTAPVGSFPTTDLSDHGVVDLFGNVREWTMDDWDDYAYVRQAAEGIPIDPVVLLEDARFGTLAGGCFRTGGLVWGREREDISEATWALGFRCAYPGER